MTIKWRNDAELFEIARTELFTAVVGDAMDKLGLYHQFLLPGIRPLKSDTVLIGRAMPALAVDVSQECFEESKSPLSKKTFGLMLEALDDLCSDEIYVCSGSSPRCALWGELMTIRAQKLGAGGAVLNGYVRDTKALLSLNFPTFALGSFGQDSTPRLKVVDFRVPIEIGNVHVRPGDIVFGDIDGLCVIPNSASPEVFARAIEKARGERTVKKALDHGMRAVDAFAKYAIL